MITLCPLHSTRKKGDPAVQTDDSPVQRARSIHSQSVRTPYRPPHREPRTASYNESRHSSPALARRRTDYNRASKGIQYVSVASGRSISK